MSNLTISQEQLEFWTNFYINDKTTEEDLCSWACNKAYLDVCRTIKFNHDYTEKERLDARKNVATCIHTRIDEFHKNIPAQDPKRKTFDKWHEYTCEEIINNFEVAELTFGQAQKWLNMTIKYLWLIHSIYGNSKNGLFEKYNEFMSYSKHFHVPLDSYILDYIKTEYNLEFNYKWSKINKYEDYVNYQINLSNILVNGKSPIEWELEHWPKALGK